MGGGFAQSRYWPDWRNIVTNELLKRGFLVTHLDKGTRGVSANADLLVGHYKLTKAVLIQVKACEPQNQGKVFMGAFRKGSLYNAKPGFHADFIVSIAITSLKDYRIFVLPIDLAESVR